MKVEVRIAGFGGQGIVLSGLMLASAACLYEGKNVVCTQSYGPESRGSHCRSDIIISDEEVDALAVERPDILIVMSDEAYREYLRGLKSGGILLVDPDMIRKREPIEGIEVYEVPATRMAEELGRAVVANVIMLGALTSITNVVSEEAMRKSIIRYVPKGTESLNIKAFERGLDYGREPSVKREA